jgi:hypothetical protein
MKNNSNIKILVCTHKKDYVKNDDVFMPIHAGKAISNIDLGIQGDNTGDNISEKNPYYCELTAHYWAWKNLKSIDYIGLCHYRRYFDFNCRVNKLLSIKKVSQNEFQSFKFDISKIINSSDIILSKHKVYPYSLAVDYSVCHISEDYRIMKQIINDLSPEYNDSFSYIFDSNNKLSHYNMFLTRWDIFEEYSSWLFLILDEAEKRINISSYNTIQQRSLAYMGERLLNVFVYKKQFKIKYLPVYWIVEEPINNSLFKSFLGKIRRDISFLLNKK